MLISSTSSTGKNIGGAMAMIMRKVGPCLWVASAHFLC